MSTDDTRLGSTSSGFALAAAITVVINTMLAIAKDLSPALVKTMASLAGHHWTAQGILDIVLFVGLGLIFTKSRIAAKMASQQIIVILVLAVIAAGGGLSLWYLVY